MLLDPSKACLFVSCMQKEFLPIVHESQRLVDSCCWLVDLMDRLSIPTLILNHTKLGEPLACFLNRTNVQSTEMTTFSFLDHHDTRNYMKQLGKTQFLLAGAETHVSILQSAVALKEIQLEPFVVADGCSSRQKYDHTSALKRLSSGGISCVTKEMVFFECLRKSDRPDYRDLSLTFLDQRYLRF